MYCRTFDTKFGKPPHIGDGVIICDSSEAMGLHIAAASISCEMPSDIFGELVRTDDLIEEGIVFENGSVIVPRGIGLGVSLDRKAMEQFAKSGLIV